MKHVEEIPASQTIEQLAEEEAKAAAHVKAAEEEAVKIIENARVNAQEVIAEARLKGEREREAVLAEKQAKIDAECEKILAEARKEASNLKARKGVARKLLDAVVKG